MTNQFDALNNLTSADEEDIKEQIEKYFDEMDLDEPEKERRIGLATDIEKGFRNLFVLMLTAQIVGESLEARRDDYVDFVYHDYTDAMIENGYSSDEYYTGQGYVEQYARRRCEEIVDTAILHKADSYYFSTDHSIAIGEDETNAVGNYQREQMAIAQGYTMKTWVTFQDDKVRHSHRLLQGRTINIFKPFEVGTGLMMFPLDVSLGVNMREVYNCRCICEYSGKTKEKSESIIPDEALLGATAAIYTSEIVDEIENKRLSIEAENPFKNPSTPLTIESYSQSKHIRGGEKYNFYMASHEYEPSYVTVSESEMQNLVDIYHGTGILKLDRNGNVIQQELIVDNDSIVGVAVNNLNGIQEPTSAFKIHYSQRGTHIVPTYESQKQYWKDRREQDGHNWLLRQKS